MVGSLDRTGVDQRDPQLFMLGRALRGALGEQAGRMSLDLLPVEDVHRGAEHGRGDQQGIGRVRVACCPFGDRVGRLHLRLAGYSAGGQVQPGGVVEPVGVGEPSRAGESSGLQLCLERTAPQRCCPLRPRACFLAADHGLGEAGQQLGHRLGPADLRGELGQQRRGRGRGFGVGEERQDDLVEDGDAVGAGRPLQQRRAIQACQDAAVRAPVPQPGGSGPPGGVERVELAGMLLGPVRIGAR